MCAHHERPHAHTQDYYRAVCNEVMDYGGMPPPSRSYSRSYGDPYGSGYSRGGPSSLPPDSEGSTILKLRGLPFSVSDDDICAWFNDDTGLGITPVVKDK